MSYHSRDLLFDIDLPCLVVEKNVDPFEFLNIMMYYM